MTRHTTHESVELSYVHCVGRPPLGIDRTLQEASIDGSGIVIRRIEPADVDAFRRIRLEALSAEPTSFASSYEDWVAPSSEEWQQRLKDPVFVAFHNDEPVGITGLLRQRASKMAHRATIVMVCVCKKLAWHWSRRTAPGRGLELRA